MLPKRVSITHLSLFTHRSTLYLFLLFFCAVCAPLSIPSRVFAATNPITITSQSASTIFSKEIDFQVGVQDTASSITQASITITMTKPSYSQQTYDVPVATPGQGLHLTWKDTISGDNFVMSGTPLTYAWAFHDKNDSWFTGTSQQYTVIDSRFQWQHLSQDQLQVNWYGQGTDFGQIVLSQALDNIQRISTNLGGQPTSPITLWVYQSSDDFRGALPPNTFEWVGGLAYPPLNEAFIVVDSPNADTLVRDMPHELTHVLFHELVPLTDLIPTWFDEGLAVYNQTYHEPDMNQRFQRALATHTLLRFDTLTNGFASDTDKAYLAYAQSWNFISYMYSTFGLAKMTHLIKLMGNGDGTFESQVTSAFGEDSTHIENQWRVSLHQPAILAPSQTTPTLTRKVGVGTPATNPLVLLVPWLLSAGVLLVLLSIFSISGLLYYQRRRNRAASQATLLTFSPPGPMYPPHYYRPPVAAMPPSHNVGPHGQGQGMPYGHTILSPVSRSVSYTDPARYGAPPVPAQRLVSAAPPSPSEYIPQQLPDQQQAGAIAPQEDFGFTGGRAYVSPVEQRRRFPLERYEQQVVREHASSLDTPGETPQN